MTGGGSGELAFALEPSLFTNPETGSPSYYEFGVNAQITDVSLENELARLRRASDLEAFDSIKQSVEGAFGVEGTVDGATQGEVESLVFNDGGTAFTDTARPQSASIFVGVDYLDGTTERALRGFIPTSYSVSYSQGANTTFSLTGIYRAEDESASITPSAVTTGDKSQVVTHHSTDVSLSGVSIGDKLQSATLSIENIARFQRGNKTKAVDAVMANSTTTLTATAVYTGPDALDRAYGTSLSNVTGTVDLTSASGAVSTYDLPKCKPESVGWDAVLDNESDTTQSQTLQVNGGVTVA